MPEIPLIPVITLAPQKRNGLKLLEDFCAAVSQSSGTPVLIGTVPTSLFFRYGTEAGAKDQKARTFLVNEFDRMTGQARLSWQLFYSAQMKTNFLNIPRSSLPDLWRHSFSRMEQVSSDLFIRIIRGKLPFALPRNPSNIQPALCLRLVQIPPCEGTLALPSG